MDRRGKRLSRAFMALWAGVRIWLEEQELDRTISSIADYNAPSIAAHRSLGMKMMGHVAVLRVGRIQLTLKGGAPRIAHVKRRPDIVLPVG